MASSSCKLQSSSPLVHEVKVCDADNVDLKPKQPGNNIDVYLAPLIEDLKMLWEKGVECFDGSREETFTL